MPVILDSYYTIGKGHLYCQDYALQGWEPFPYLILADGCSASANSDLGARLLALSARQALARFARLPREGSKLAAQHWRLGHQIVRRARRQVRALGIDQEVLDATLVVAWCDGVSVHVRLYGDGCIVARRADGQLSVITIEYAENAPYYLSYLLDPKRRMLYQEAVGNPQGAQVVRQITEAKGGQVWHECFDAPLAYSFDLATFPIVAVATDGLDSFINVESGMRIGVWEVAQALLDFADTYDDFVMRQVQYTLIAFSERHWFNFDDLSLGAFVRRR